MCVIAIKPAGVPLPSSEIRRHMFLHNPHGGGFMYPKYGWVKIEKGFMTLESMETRLAQLMEETDTTALPMVLHYRVTTLGGTCPENCHPFPLCNKLSRLTSFHERAKIGVAHNGSIPITPRPGLSDSMEYVLTRLSTLPEGFLDDPLLVSQIEKEIASKMVFLTAEGRIVALGEFTEDSGILYSNLSYRYPRNEKWEILVPKEPAL